MELRRVYANVLNREMCLLDSLPLGYFGVPTKHSLNAVRYLCISGWTDPYIKSPDYPMQ